MVHVIGVHSIVRCDGTKGLASVWLDFDAPDANEGMGVLMLHIDECDVVGVSHDEIMAMLEPTTRVLQ
ncbi:MAG: hypothetical protein WA706_10380 [Pseudolabrys sp.]